MGKESQLKVAVIGGSGYSGRELLRLLLAHPHADLAAVGSSSSAGKPVGEVISPLAGRTELAFAAPEEVAGGGHDAVFFAAPEGVASELAPAVIESGGVAIDIGPDFRLKDPAEWAAWYGMEHKAPSLLDEAVYGLTETSRDSVRNARIIACPGCYPTASLLALHPLLAAGTVDPAHIIIDAKSGVTGAGRKTGRPELLFAEVDGNLTPYKVGGHRHVPEMVRALEGACGEPAKITFVPHLISISRGLLATIYVHPKQGKDLRAALESFCRAEPFVALTPEGTMPAVESVRRTNDCRIGVHQPQTGSAVVVSAIDNLGKGAAGQAVQNMNVRFGLREDSGLQAAPA